jgi:hypothetical protein
LGIKIGLRLKIIWMIPKKTRFEKDVLDLIPEDPLPGRAGRLKQFLIKHVMAHQQAQNPESQGRTGCWC